MKCVFGATLLLVLASHSQASTILFSEPADGDLGNSYATPTNLGTLTEGSYTVDGSINGSDVWDTFRYQVAQGYRLQHLYISNYYNTSVDSYWSGLCFDDGAYTSPCLGYINASQNDIGLDLLQFGSAPGIQGVGQYFTGMTYVTQNTTSSDYASYQLELVVTAVPVPASLWLFGCGLLGLLSWTRRHRS